MPQKRERRKFRFLLSGIPKLLYRYWIAFGHVLGWINTRIILGFTYYIIFLPIGIVMKLGGKDPMTRIIDKTQNTYRVPYDKRKKMHVERPF